MSYTRRLEGFVSKELATVIDQEGDFHAVDFPSAKSHIVLIPRSALESAGLDFTSNVDPEGVAVIAADVDIEADDLDFGVNVREVAFKGWLPGLDEPLYQVEG